jgi:hypothetical protein
VVAVVEYRDGTVIDVVRQARPAERAAAGQESGELGAVA